MGHWGKIIGGVTGFALGGPFGAGLFGAVIGAAVGHAADSGAIPNMRLAFGAEPRISSWSPARVAALLGRKDQLFTNTVVVLSAKLAKCDGAVSRAEIDAFKSHFRVPPESVRDIGRLFDQARDSTEEFGPYADQLGEVFADNRGMLEDVLAALFAVARADGPVNRVEHEFLVRTHSGFRLDQAAWDRARGATPRSPARNADDAPDPYEVLGVARSTGDDDLHAAWKQLMRENHPDSLAARGVPAEFIARASDKVARINAAWDQIKRERGL